MESLLIVWPCDWSDWQPSLTVVNSDCVELWFYQLVLLWFCKAAAPLAGKSADVPFQVYRLIYRHERNAGL